MLDEAISEYKKAIIINPNLPFAHYCLGDIYRKKEMYDQAISEYKKVIANAPNDEDFTKIFPYQAHFGIAYIYSEKGMKDEAISEYKEVLTINPDNSRTHFNIALEYGKKGSMSLASDHFYKAGLLYIKEDNREGALKAYELLKKTDSKKLEQALFEKLYPELKQKKSKLTQ